jgi:Tfp pilus assembly protein PilE
MKSIATVVSVVGLVFGVAILAQTQTESVEQELIKLENDSLQAFLKNDIVFYERFLADDYMGTDEHGNVKTKTQEIAEIKAG